MIPESELNKFGFEGDFYLKETVQSLTEQFNIEVAVETGTYYGNTTRELGSLFSKVHSIEINSDVHEVAQQRLQNYDNISLYLGNSPQVLSEILPTIDTRVLFYLDAHWNKYWPLKDELEVIARERHGEDVILIHDFLVPDSDFGFDSYPVGWISETVQEIFPRAIARLDKLSNMFFGEDLFAKVKLDWNYVDNHIQRIFPSGFRRNYNSEAAGAKRGIVYITSE